MKKALSFLLASVMLMPCMTACTDEIDNLPNVVVIDVKDYGKITVELYPDIAPITVKNFKKLVNEKFYDGLIFHRVIEDFMIQGGCPDGNGTGGYTDEKGNKVFTSAASKYQDAYEQLMKAMEAQGVDKIEDVDFYKAVEILAQNAGMKMPDYQDNEEIRKKKHERDRILSVLKATSDFYISNLSKVEANNHINYIRKRGLIDDMVAKFKIGASTDYYGLIKHLRKLGFTDKEMIDSGVAGRGEDGSLYDFYGTRLVFPIVNGLGEVAGH